MRLFRSPGTDQVRRTRQQSGVPGRSRDARPRRCSDPSPPTFRHRRIGRGREPHRKWGTSRTAAGTRDEAPHPLATRTAVASGETLSSAVPARLQPYRLGSRAFRGVAWSRREGPHQDRRGGRQHAIRCWDHRAISLRAIGRKEADVPASHTSALTPSPRVTLRDRSPGGPQSRPHRRSAQP